MPLQPPIELLAGIRQRVIRRHSNLEETVHRFRRRCCVQSSRKNAGQERLRKLRKPVSDMLFKILRQPRNAHHEWRLKTFLGAAAVIRICKLSEESSRASSVFLGKSTSICLLHKSPFLMKGRENTRNSLWMFE
jgi:hypothetical protein